MGRYEYLFFINIIITEVIYIGIYKLFTKGRCESKLETKVSQMRIKNQPRLIGSF